MHPIGYFLLLLLLSAVRLNAQDVLTNLAAVNRLSLEEFRARRPVAVEGILLYSDAMLSGGGTIFDGQEGIYFRMTTNQLTTPMPPIGSRIRITALTRVAKSGRNLEALSLTVLGPGILPQPKEVTAENLYDASLNFQWVRVRGFVDNVKDDHKKRVFLTIKFNGWSLPVVFPWTEENWRELPKLKFRQVEFEGVANVTYNDQCQATDRDYLVPSTRHIRVLAKAGSVQAAIPLRMDELLRDGITPETVVRVRGVVTEASPDELYLRGGGGSIRVRKATPELFQSGDEVEVEGVCVISPFRPVLLAQTVVRKTSGPSPQPVPVIGWTAEIQRLHNELISAQVEYLGSSEGMETVILHCRQGKNVVEARLPQSIPFPADLVPGCRVQLTGICKLTTSYPLPLQYLVDGYWIQLLNANDLKILSYPAWWTPRKLLMVLGGSLGFGIMAVLMVWQLRQQVSGLKRRIVTQAGQAAILNERQRIARDLHDTVEQQLTGIAIQLEHVDNQSRKSPEIAAQALNLARQMIRHCRQEVGHAIQDFRCTLLELDGLPGAMEKTLRGLATEGRARFEFELAGRAIPLGGVEENHFLRLAQESMANAVHHAEANEIKARLEYGPDAVIFTLRDDGRGFDSASAPPSGHFGLIGMNERAEKINARLEIQSAPGKGTLVRVLWQRPAQETTKSAPL